MRESRLALADNTRQASIALLQSVLADAIALRLAVKQAHGTARDPRFIQLRELFDSFGGPLDEEIDTIAERLAALGGQPNGTAAAAASSRLPDYDPQLSAGNGHLEALAEGFALLGDYVRKAIDEAAEAGDANTADVFTATSRFCDKTLWFLEAHANG